MIYLDNSATTRIDDEVLDVMIPLLHNEYGNPSSIYKLGRQARILIEDAREEIAMLIGAHPAELIFTSGGTESNNTVLKSCLIESKLADSLFMSTIEHHAILHPAEELRQEGFSVQILPANFQGEVEIEQIPKNFSKRSLLSIMHANNETGIITPIKKYRTELPDFFFHTDAVQSFGKMHFNVQDLGVDFASFSAHKIHGPKGIGALFIRKGIDFKAHQQGGAQERNRRAGTESVALIVGFQIAARNAVNNLEKCAEIMRERINLLRFVLSQKIQGINFNTPIENSLPNILNISFQDANKLDGEAILQGMDMQEIAVSNGSACVSGSQQASHVLLAMNRSNAESKAAVRFSVSKYTTEHEIITAVDALAEIICDMRENLNFP